MRIYLDYTSVYSVKAGKIDTYINASAGTHNLIIQAWDSTGTSFKNTRTVSISSSGSGTTSGSKTFSNIDQMTGWDDCTVCAGPDGQGKVASYSMKQSISSPSMDGKSAQFYIGGTNKYASAIWWKQLGANSAPTHFVYDLYFYIKNANAAFALEFDVNQSTLGKRWIMGTQCGNNYDKQWDVWDGIYSTWRPTGISCTGLAPYVWHHLTEEFYRANGRVYYVSITLDGVKHYINRNYGPKPNVSANDINVAFQMDLNSTPTSYNAWLDKVKLTYW